MTKTKTRPFCPHLTQGQIVSFGLVGNIVPIGEADVTGGADIAAVGRNLSKGGIDLSAIGRKLPVYQADFTAKFKTPKGADPKDPDPTLLPTAGIVPCQGPACAFWCETHQDCREVCNRCKVETFARALATLVPAGGIHAVVQHSTADQPNHSKGSKVPEETA